MHSGSSICKIAHRYLKIVLRRWYLSYYNNTIIVEECLRKSVFLFIIICTSPLQIYHYNTPKIYKLSTTNFDDFRPNSILEILMEYRFPFWFSSFIGWKFGVNAHLRELLKWKIPHQRSCNRWHSTVTDSTTDVRCWNCTIVDRSSAPFSFGGEIM